MPRVARHGDRGIKGVIGVAPKALHETTDAPLTAVVGDAYYCRKHSDKTQQLKNGCLFYKPHGQPAAMQYATKASCGCRIIEGSDLHSCCPHLDDKARRLAEREILIEQARDRAETCGTTQEAAILRRHADEFERLNRDVRFAEMSAAVYQSPDAPRSLSGGYGNAPEGSIRLTAEEFMDLIPEPLHNPDLTWDDEKSGFYADLYYDELHGSYTVAYRGTDPALNDIEADHAQAHGLRNTQYDQAMDIGRQLLHTRLDNRYEGVELAVTGHSLGGGLASAAGTVGGVPYITLNAAGLHPNTVSRYTDGKLSNADGAHLGVAYSTEHDPLTWAQTPEGSKALYAAVPAIGKGFRTAGSALPAALPLNVFGKTIELLKVFGSEVERYAQWSKSKTGDQLPPSPAATRHFLRTTSIDDGGVSRELDGARGWVKGHSSMTILDSIEAAKTTHELALRGFLACSTKAPVSA